MLETVNPLVNYDEEKGSDLLNTLEAFFQCNGNLKRMSERLFTHYNTILYRMQRIRQVTGADLNDPDQRLRYEVGLKIYRLFSNGRGFMELPR